MTEHQLHLTARQRPEMLERILRVVRHRGFIVTQLHMQLAENQVQLQISAQSDPRIDFVNPSIVKIAGCHECGIDRTEINYPFKRVIYK